MSDHTGPAGIYDPGIHWFTVADHLYTAGPEIGMEEQVEAVDAEMQVFPAAVVNDTASIAADASASANVTMHAATTGAFVASWGIWHNAPFRYK